MPRTTGDGPRTHRGISLLEVLISMFVLLFGLMGVAAIFPVGNHYAGKGEQFDRSTALGDSALAEMKARGVLRPEMWWYSSFPLTGSANGGPQFIQPSGTGSPNPNSFNIPLPANSGDPGPGYAFVLDPLGTASEPLGSRTNFDVFPIADFSQAAYPDGAVNSQMPGNWVANNTTPGLDGGRWPIRRLTLPAPNPDPDASVRQATPEVPISTSVAEAIFRLRDDLAVEFPKESDRPARQRWTVDQNGYPDDPTRHTRLARQFSGNYSWLATIVPARAEGHLATQPARPEGLLGLQPAWQSFGSNEYDVTVAVLYKRVATPSAATERAIPAQLFAGGELVVFSLATNADAETAVDNAIKDIHSGQWIALAGVNPTTGQFLLKWYRVLSLDDESTTGDVVVQTEPVQYQPAKLRRATLEGPDWPETSTSGVPAINLRAILMPGVIAATTETVSIGPAESEWGQ